MTKLMKWFDNDWVFMIAMIIPVSLWALMMFVLTTVCPR